MVQTRNCSKKFYFSLYTWYRYLWDICRFKSLKWIFSYVLKYASIIGDIVNLDGLKVVGVPKARKW